MLESSVVVVPVVVERNQIVVRSIPPIGPYEERTDRYISVNLLYKDPTNSDKLAVGFDDQFEVHPGRPVFCLTEETARRLIEELQEALSSSEDENYITELEYNEEEGESNGN